MQQSSSSKPKKSRNIRVSFLVPEPIHRIIEQNQENAGRNITDQWSWMYDFYLAMLEKHGKDFISEIVVAYRNKRNGK